MGLVSGEIQKASWPIREDFIEEVTLELSTEEGETDVWAKEAWSPEDQEALSHAQPPHPAHLHHSHCSHTPFVWPVPHVALVSVVHELPDDFTQAPQAAASCVGPAQPSLRVYGQR